jgi:hypothetical protein
MQNCFKLIYHPFLGCVTARDGNGSSELGRCSRLAEGTGEMTKHFVKDMIALYIHEFVAT